MSEQTKRDKVRWEPGTRKTYKPRFTDEALRGTTVTVLERPDEDGMVRVRIEREMFVSVDDLEDR